MERSDQERPKRNRKTPIEGRRATERRIRRDVGGINPLSVEDEHGDQPVEFNDKSEADDGDEEYSETAEKSVKESKRGKSRSKRREKRIGELTCAENSMSKKEILQSPKGNISTCSPARCLHRPSRIDALYQMERSRFTGAFGSRSNGNDANSTTSSLSEIPHQAKANIVYDDVGRIPSGCTEPHVI